MRIINNNGGEKRRRNCYALEYKRIHENTQYIQKIFNCKEVRFLITLGIIREEELIQDICFIHKIKMSYRLNEKKY